MRAAAALAAFLLASPALAETPAERASRLLAATVGYDRSLDAVRAQTPPRPRRVVLVSQQPGAATMERPNP